MAWNIEDTGGLPGVKYNGFNTLKACNLCGVTIDTSGNVVIPGNLTVSGTTFTDNEATAIKSTSANSLAVGANGATNPVLNVDASTASVATGVQIKGAAAGAGVAEQVISSGTNESLTINAKGNGTINLNNTGTGLVILGRGGAQVPIMSNTLASLAGTNQTLTAAQLLGGIIEHAPTGAATDTTDTGTNIDAAIPGAAVGDTFEVMVVNTSAGANAITLAGGTGVTLKGTTATIGQNKTGFLVFRKTGVATYTCYVTVSS